MLISPRRQFSHLHATVLCLTSVVERLALKFFFSVSNCVLNGVAGTLEVKFLFLQKEKRREKTHVVRTVPAAG